MLQNLPTVTFAKFQKSQLDNLVDFEKMLQDAYFLAKIGADTAENEQHFAKKMRKTDNYPTRCSGQGSRRAGAAPRLGRGRFLSKTN